jgi:3-hydroxypropanoate dehydrogenase
MPATAIDDAALRQLFLDARTHNAWLDRPVSDELLHRLYEVARLGPTAANMTPMRVVFVKSAAAKEKLKPALSPGNLDKTMQAPVTAIVAYDVNFHEFAPKLFPSRDMKTGLAAMPAEAREKMAFMVVSRFRWKRAGALPAGC